MFSSPLSVDWFLPRLPAGSFPAGESKSQSASWPGLGWAGSYHILVFNHHFSSPVKRAGLDMDGHATTSFPYCLSPSYFLTEGQFCGSQQYCWTLLSVVLRDPVLCLENSEIVSRAAVSCYLSGTTGNFTQRNYILLKKNI